ncbi:MAG: FAD-binding protein, partial [Planctomycetes bacterium]|nr:FAD-binding protein [Planctomycetota bacterium]
MSAGHDESAAARDAELSRRRLLGAALTAGAGQLLAPVGAAERAWTRLAPAPAGSEAASLPPLADFPSSVTLVQETFKNWSGELQQDDAWTCQPATQAEVILVAHWAARAGYTLRVRGYAHNWSPLVISEESIHAGAASEKVLLVDLRVHWQGMQMTGSTPPAVTVEGGVSMEDLLAFLESSGCGVTSCPAPGDITIGGVLAIDGHGTGVPAGGEARLPGQTFGSMSNRVLSLKVLAWDPQKEDYGVRTFTRTDPEMRALMVSLGRTILLEVTLRVEENHNLRCQSYVNIPGSELFGPPGSGGQTLESLVEESGRVETIWYPFTDNPWLKVWKVTPTKPWISREVDGPYNYPFSDNISEEASDLIEQIVNGAAGLTPLFGQVMYTTTVLGLLFNGSYDLWGPSKNLLHYIRPTTLRVTANGYAIVTRRDNIQSVVHRFVERYEAQMQDYAANGLYPINGPSEIRVTGLDHSEEVDLPRAQEPTRSAVVPREDHPEWDVAVWLDLLTIPGTPSSSEFYAELEEWLFEEFNDDDATIRVEWSKGWGY